jgi:glycosyl transferase family 25
MTMNINFYVINLDRSTERLELISSQLSNQKINVKRIPAIDGIEINIDKEADDSMCKSEMGRSIQPGEVGCFLSHIKALETFISSKSDFAVILEDDAIIQSEFYIRIKALCNFLVTNQYSKLFAINLGPSDYKYTTKIKSLANFELLRAHRFPMLATGILWTREGAALVLSHKGKVKYPYDNYLRILLTNNSNGMSVKPALVKAAEVSSDIEARSITKGRSKENRSNFYFFKKQRRVFREKILAVFSILKWNLNKPKYK